MAVHLHNLAQAQGVICDIISGVITAVLAAVVLYAVITAVAWCVGSVVEGQYKKAGGGKNPSERFTVIAQPYIPGAVTLTCHSHIAPDGLTTHVSYTAAVNLARAVMPSGHITEAAHVSGQFNEQRVMWSVRYCPLCGTFTVTPSSVNGRKDGSLMPDHERTFILIKERL